MAPSRNRSSDLKIQQVSTVKGTIPNSLTCGNNLKVNSLYDFNYASQAKLSKRFYNLTLKLHVLTANIWFNKQCLTNNVTPTYAKLTDKHKTAASRKTIHAAQILRIKNEIRSLYSTKSKTNTKLLHTHLELVNLIQTENFIALRHSLKHIIHKHMENKYNRLHKKLNTLIIKKTTPTYTNQFHPRTVNLTDTKFTQYETNLIDKGLKHNLPTNRTKDLENLIIDTELAINKIPQDQQTHARHLAVKILHKIQNSYNKPTQQTDIKTLQHIKRKIIDNKLTLTKADKGNSTVIMKTDDYNTKTLEFINSNGFKKLKSDPTKLFQAQIRTAIKLAPDFIRTKDRTKYINPNPSQPILKSLPKIHKPNIPIRPILNYRPSPAYRLSKFLAETIKTYAELEDKHVLKNSLDFATSITNLKIPSTARLISLDVTNLYTSIPITETLQILEEKILLNNNHNITEQLIQLTRTTLKQNYFTFNNEHFTATDGLGMGNPTSSILSEVFMQSLEDVYVQRIANEFGVTYYKRYVDDCFLIIDTATGNTDKLLSYMNNLHPNIHFTAENEHDNQLNYLDICITRQPNTLKLSIYRKPTSTDQTIHASSNHPRPHKLAAYRTMIHRLHTIPMDPTDYRKELNTIYNIAHNNGFTRQTIDRLISQRRNKPTGPDNNKPWVTLTYIGKDTYRLKNLFSTYNLNTAFKTLNQLGKKLTPSTNKNTSTYEHSGVYKLTCNDCNRAYIGRTGRTLNTRYKEHIRSYINNKHDSNYAEHLRSHQHEPDTINNTMTLLHKQHMGPRLNMLEKLEIYKHRTLHGDIINEQTHSDSDITFSVLENTLRKRQRDEPDLDRTYNKKQKIK